MPFAIVDGPTIDADQSLSDGANCSAGEMVRITVPQEFTEADLTFQVSSDGKFYNDLYDAAGNEIVIKAKPDTGIVLQSPWIRSIAYVKIRSGTRLAPVVQQEKCKFGIALRV
jgi:hypothetical protein